MTTTEEDTSESRDLTAEVGSSEDTDMEVPDTEEEQSAVRTTTLTPAVEELAV